MSARNWLIAILTSGFALTTAIPAQAAVIWDGDASRGTGVFEDIAKGECEAPGSVTAVDDATHGKVWRFHKPAGDRRCESRGIRVGGGKYTFRNNTTVYLGWRSKLSSTVNNNAIFQWKSYASHIQNFPVVLKVINGRISMLQRQPGPSEKIIWSQPITANSWNHYVIGLGLSSATRGGWVELWFNGVRQSFTDGTQRYACRTFDSQNDPKWGIYGASGTTVTNYVDGLKVGTGYADVAATAGSRQ
ncbi:MULTISPECIES: heparin lyase I family protein [unclassified Crossiella]|uniref:heparin lyase I family protein n=1 Tax=unclassified Crossiella TaxID=2620835 RepID=UPI001FFF27E7|nr:MULTISPECIES: heparin lyase I family protein [unclassified Crossiella]MCK2238590.1 polysaccharide lyase [Crossiella sp. S99.2]MCK2251840.1 polysaccharide lyase [Crossiella sp. S99.1]